MLLYMDMTHTDLPCGIHFGHSLYGFFKQCHGLPQESFALNDLILFFAYMQKILLLIHRGKI